MKSARFQHIRKAIGRNYQWLFVLGCVLFLLLSLSSQQLSQLEIKILAHDTITHFLIAFDTVTQLLNQIHFSLHNLHLCLVCVSN